MRRRRFSDAALLGGALLLVVLMAALRASLSNAAPSVPSTYDTGLHGYAALYALLGREGVRVSRFEDPPPSLFRRRGALVVAGDGALVAAAGSKDRAQALDAWVRRGATLILAGAPPDAAMQALGLPKTHKLRATAANGACGLPRRLRGAVVSGAFKTGSAASCRGASAALLTARGHAVALAYRRGKGTVIVAYDAGIFDNAHLLRDANAAFAYALFADVGPVAFNERVYGHASGRSFWQVTPLPMRVALALAVLALLAGIAGANLPFVPPYTVPPAGGRDSSEYIASLARLLDRGGARRETIARLCNSASGALRLRADADPVARALLGEAQRLQHLLHPRSQDVLAAGQLFARVRKDYP